MPHHCLQPTGRPAFSIQQDLISRFADEATASDVNEDLTMRMPAIAVLLMLVSGAPLSAQAPSRVFREVTVAPVGRIALGEPLARPDRFTQVRDGLYELKPARGPAKSIMVAIDSSSVVRAVFVTYARGRDYAASRAAYVRPLGRQQKSMRSKRAGSSKVQRGRIRPLISPS
jgi:hypothetical protein